MTYGKETLPVQLEYRRSRPAQLEISLRLRLFLFFVTGMAIGFGVMLAYLVH